MFLQKLWMDNLQQRKERKINWDAPIPAESSLNGINGMKKQNSYLRLSYPDLFVHERTLQCQSHLCSFPTQAKRLMEPVAKPARQFSHVMQIFLCL